jgi:hypothetical protein
MCDRNDILPISERERERKNREREREADINHLSFLILHAPD